MILLHTILIQHISELFNRVAEAYEVLRSQSTRAIFDQFGEEGLKNGLPQKNGGWSEGYTFHGDAKRVFRDFFGTDNPFADFQVTILHFETACSFSATCTFPVYTLYMKNTFKLIGFFETSQSIFALNRPYFA